MEKIPIPHPTFFKTVEDNESFVASLKEKLQLLTRFMDILQKVHSMQFLGDYFIPATVQNIEYMACKEGLHLGQIPNNVEVILLLHDTERAIYDIKQFIQFYNVRIEGGHILSIYGDSDNFVWESYNDADGKRYFSWLHHHLKTINQFLPCSIDISSEILPTETTEFIDYLIKGYNCTDETLEVGFYRGCRHYTEEEYIDYYYSVFPNLDTDIEDLLRRHYKSLRMIQRQAWHLGKGVCDYIGYELEVAPIEAIFNYGYCILTYIPKTHSLLGIGVDVEITEIPDGLQEKAAFMAMNLIDYYGTIYINHSNLKDEFERMKGQFTESQFSNSDFE